ncbi:MAG: dipeptide epimerase [Candidatus Sumerlaeota bacterium]|nr:dipeptide epimerase [Candidatus Sumerlaeota bacterium]
MGSALIKDLKVDVFDLPLKEPFIIATGRKDAANNVLVRVFLEDGTVGYGEVSPSPYTTGETQQTCIAVLNHIKWAVVGQDIRQWRALLARTRKLIRANVGAHSGLEIAVLDAFTRYIGIPLCTFFGGAITSIETDLTLSFGTPDETAVAATKALEQGFNKIKIKVGMGVATDTERTVRVREAAPKAVLSLDANQAYAPKDAVELARRIHAEGIEIDLLEQPVRKDDIEGLRFVREHCPVPVAADESCFTADDAIRLIRADAVDVINIKVAKCGLVGALDIVSICRAANKGLMVGSMMEAKIGLAASVHLACGLGEFLHHDLDTVYLLKPFDCKGGYTQDGPKFSIEGIQRGTGIEYTV